MTAAVSYQPSAFSGEKNVGASVPLVRQRHSGNVIREVISGRPALRNPKKGRQDLLRAEV
jgi:hypothetical protein